MADFAIRAIFRGLPGRQRNSTGRVVRVMRNLRNTLVLLSFGWLAACGGGGEDAVAPPAIAHPRSIHRSRPRGRRSLYGAGHLRHGPGYLRRERRQALRKDVRDLLGRPARGDRIVIENGRGPGVDAPRRPGISDAGLDHGRSAGLDGPAGRDHVAPVAVVHVRARPRSAVHFVSGHHAGRLRGDHFPAGAGGAARHAVRLWQHASARGGAHGGGDHRRDVGEPLCHATEDAAGAHFTGPRVVHGAAPGGGDFESARRGWDSRHDE